MQIWMVALLGANLGLAAFLIWRQQLQLARLNALETQAVALGAATGSLPVDLKTVLGDGPNPMITIEILNPMEVAARESWVAGAVGNLSPPLIRSIVYKRAREQIVEQLRERGLQAKVEVRRSA